MKMRIERLGKLQTLMKDEGFSILAVNAGSQLKYLTGLDFHLSERPVILLVPGQGSPALLFPEFEKEKVQTSEIDLELFAYGENPDTWLGCLLPAVETMKLKYCPIGVPPQSMRFLELELMQTAVGHHHFLSASNLIMRLTIQKDQAEIDEIQKAVIIAEKAIEDLLSENLTGKSEREIANALVIKLLENGSEPDLPFNPIVASGPNSANPHAVPGNRIIQKGDMLVIDWGANSGGYISDITRTFQVGVLEEDFLEISRIVLHANITARNCIKPGKEANEIDQAARKVMEDAGYGEFFIHRTGHGIGMLAHEEPYISESSRTNLSPGMVFTIEPGIYLPGKGGIRIEDNILVTEEASFTLTHLPRELRKIE